MKRGLRVILCVLVVWASSFQVMALPDSSTPLATTKLKIKEVTQRIKQQPKDAQAFAKRATLKLEVEDVYGAIKDFSTALTLTNAKQAAYLTGRGNAFLEIGAYKEALQDFEAALVTGLSAESLYGRAVAKYYLEDYFGAIRDLDQVIEIAPAHSKALYNRAVVKLELNKVEEAVADIKAFLALYPGHADAENALAVANNRLVKRVAVR